MKRKSNTIKIFWAFGGVTALLLLVFLKGDPIWCKNSGDFNYHKVTEFFTAFGAVATAAAFFLTNEQLRLARTDFLNKTEPAISVSIPDINATLLDILGVPTIHYGAVMKAKKKYAVYLNNVGLATIKLIEVFYDNYQLRSVENIEAGKYKDTWLPKSFHDNVFNIISVCTTPGSVREFSFRIRIKVIHDVLEPIAKNMTFTCSYTCEVANSGALVFSKKEQED